MTEGPKASFLEAAMQAKLLHEASGQRTFTVVLATGDEVLSCLQEFVERENIHAATFTAIGALSDAVLCYFDWESRRSAPQLRPVRRPEFSRSSLGSRLHASGESRWTKIA